MMRKVISIILFIKTIGISCQLVPGVNNLCFAPVTTGNCRARLPSFYYDDRRRSCECFIYTGCNGNANRFDDLDSCMNTCGVFPNQQTITPTCRNLFSGTEYLNHLLSRQDFNGITNSSPINTDGTGLIDPRLENQPEGNRQQSNTFDNRPTFHLPFPRPPLPPLGIIPAIIANSGSQGSNFQSRPAITGFNPQNSQFTPVSNPDFQFVDEQAFNPNKVSPSTNNNNQFNSGNDFQQNQFRPTSNNNNQFIPERDTQQQNQFRPTSNNNNQFIPERDTQQQNQFRPTSNNNNQFIPERDTQQQNQFAPERNQPIKNNQFNTPQQNIPTNSNNQFGTQINNQQSSRPTSSNNQFDTQSNNQQPSRPTSSNNQFESQINNQQPSRPTSNNNHFDSQSNRPSNRPTSSNTQSNRPSNRPPSRNSQEINSERDFEEERRRQPSRVPSKPTVNPFFQSQGHAWQKD